jgi:hypothetical protein
VIVISPQLIGGEVGNEPSPLGKSSRRILWPVGLASCGQSNIQPMHHACSNLKMKHAALFLVAFLSFFVFFVGPCDIDLLNRLGFPIFSY